MTKGMVAIVVEGEIEIHALGGGAGDYSTLCGVDANDEILDHTGYAEVPKGAKIRCKQCIQIWKEARAVPKSAFDKDTFNGE